MEDSLPVNGHWDVTERQEFLGHSYGPGRECLKRLFSIPSMQDYTWRQALMYRKVRDAALLSKSSWRSWRKVFIGAEYTILCFVLGDHVYFWNPVQWNSEVAWWKVLKQDVHCTIDRYIFDLLWKGISWRVRRYYGWRGIGKSLYHWLSVLA
jgi:hypothetical protein